MNKVMVTKEITHSKTLLTTLVNSAKIYSTSKAKERTDYYNLCIALFNFIDYQLETIEVDATASTICNRLYKKLGFSHSTDAYTAYAIGRFIKTNKVNLAKARPSSLQRLAVADSSTLRPYLGRALKMVNSGVGISELREKLEDLGIQPRARTSPLLKDKTKGLKAIKKEMKQLFNRFLLYRKYHKLPTSNVRLYLYEEDTEEVLMDYHE